MSAPRFAALLLLTPLLILAQQFEVATIKPSGQDVQTQTSAGIHIDGAMVRYSALDLTLYLGMAYKLRNYQIIAPDWMTSGRWDITAKLPDGSTPTQIPDMLQSLLRDRFQMKTHRETRELPVYALIIGKGGLHLNESPPDPDNAPASPPTSVNAAISANSGTTVTYGNGAYFRFGNSQFEGRKLTVTIIADALARFADRPVIDMTGLTGKYDFNMEFSPEDFRAMMIRAAIASGASIPPEVLKLADASSGDTLFNAVEKLGLKLDRRKAPIETLVIDQSLRTPTAN